MDEHFTHVETMAASKFARQVFMSVGLSRTLGTDGKSPRASPGFESAAVLYRKLDAVEKKLKSEGFPAGASARLFLGVLGDARRLPPGTPTNLLKKLPLHVRQTAADLETFGRVLPILRGLNPKWRALSGWLGLAAETQDLAKRLRIFSRLIAKWPAAKLPSTRKRGRPVSITRRFIQAWEKLARKEKSRPLDGLGAEILQIMFDQKIDVGSFTRERMRLKQRR
jgi:hypothetical protein